MSYFILIPSKAQFLTIPLFGVKFLVKGKCDKFPIVVLSTWQICAAVPVKGFSDKICKFQAVVIVHRCHLHTISHYKIVIGVKKIRYFLKPA
jgi:hypothetical protein